jgi:hypothetical protein
MPKDANTNKLYRTQYNAERHDKRPEKYKRWTANDKALLKICKDHMYTYCMDLWLLQRGRCAVSGQKMTLTKGFFQVSLDRINNLRPHTIDNVRLVCACFNSTECDSGKAYEHADDVGSGWCLTRYDLYAHGRVRPGTAERQEREQAKQELLAAARMAEITQ